MITISPPLAAPGEYGIFFDGLFTSFQIHDWIEPVIAAELLTLAQNRTVTRWELAGLEWVDLGGEG